MKNYLFFICILLLPSCSGLYRFTIEVQEPAPVTLPSDVFDILVVNNSVPQPGNAGINRIFQKDSIENLPLNLDSAAATVTLALASHLQKSHFFDHVWMSPVSLRNDSHWMSVEALPDSFKTDAFNTHGFDGIISIDRHLIQLDQQVLNDFLANFKLKSSTTCSVHTYDRNNPIARFTISDSLSYITSIEGNIVEVFKELPEALIEYFAFIIGERLSEQIIPAWCEKERYLYAGLQSRMHEALRFAQKNHWNHAISLWKDEYAQASQTQAKGKLASNLAVAYEICDQFDTALQWATVAKNHFEENERATDSAANTRIDTYINDLQKRIRDNYLLDLQWGVSKDLSGKME